MGAGVGINDVYLLSDDVVTKNVYGELIENTGKDRKDTVFT